MSHHHCDPQILRTRQDEVEAAKWFSKAAEQGNAAAQFTLGVAYFQGDGVPKDLVEAYKWANLAAASGHEKAKEWRDGLEQGMIPSQIEEIKTSNEGVRRRFISSVWCGQFIVTLTQTLPIRPCK